MNELNNTSASNEINVTIGAIKLPDGMIAWEGLNIHLQLTDRACSDLNASDFQALKFALPLLAEKVETFVKTKVAMEEQRRAERKKEIEAENKALIADWETRVADFETAKAQFEREHRAWERKKEQATKNDFVEPEPKFYRERPARPHLHMVF